MQQSLSTPFDFESILKLHSAIFDEIKAKYVPEDVDDMSSWHQACSQMVTALIQCNAENDKWLTSFNAVIEDDEKVIQLLQKIPYPITFDAWQKQFNDRLSQIMLSTCDNPIVRLATYANEAMDLQDIEMLKTIHGITAYALTIRESAQIVLQSAITKEYGQDIYNQVFETVAFFDEAKDELELLTKLRIAFPEYDEMDDKQILNAFRMGDFDNKLNGVTLSEYIEATYGTSAELQFVQLQNMAQHLLYQIENTYGKDDEAYNFLSNYLERYEAEKLKEAINDTTDIIKQLHGSVGVRRVLQFGEEAADEKDMKNFSLTSTMFGEEKALDMLKAVRKEAAEYWDIAYDDEMLNTPIRDWKDNPEL